MKNSLIRIAAALLLALAISSAAKADPINGTIGFIGTNFSTDDNADFTLATKFTSFTAYTSGPGTGDYSSVTTFLPVTFTPFSFSDSGVTPLWSFTLSGITYSFDATTVSVQTTPNSIIAQGNGIASITGKDDTAGSWIITANGIGGAALTFSASTAVPDGGMTAMLVGLGLVGMSFFARRRHNKLKLAKG
jgi:hypothetical protein